MFFEMELAGEPPLERETAERLFSVARDLLPRRFWEWMTEEKLLALGDEKEELLYLHATGTLGGFISLTAYRGPKGLAFFNKVRRQEYKWAGELLAEQDFLRLRYAWRRDLRPADLKMLRTLGLPKGTSDLVPEFSSARPGFHDWHLNNDEGLVLAKALEIFDGFLDETEGVDPALIWPSVETCPWLRFGTDGLVRAVQIPLEAGVEEAGWAPPTGWPQPGLKRRGTWEIGCFHPISPVGKPKERKSITQVSVVVDGENGMALHHSMGLAGEPHLKTLWTTMAEAVENLGHLPSRLRVKDEASEAMFRALGFDVERSTEMPAFDEMQETMLGMMGDTRLDALSI